MYKRLSDYKHLSSFKSQYTPQEREQKRRGIEASYKGDSHDLSCVVLEKAQNSRLKSFKKPYFLFGINKEATLFDLRQKVSSLLELNDKESLFLICGSLIPNTNTRVKELESRKDTDGFIYLICSESDVFGR